MRAAAGLLGVEVDLPRLAQRVGLDEVALVVHVEAVVDGVLLEVGDEAGDVDDGHAARSSRSADEADASDATIVPPLDRASRRSASTVLALLHEAADAVAAALGAVDDWGLAGHPGRPVPQRPGRRRGRRRRCSARAGFGVLSEESGLHGAERRRASWSSIRSTARPTPPAGIPWYATSLCAVDADGPLAALVVNLASRRAVRGGAGRRSARATASRIAPSARTTLGDAARRAVRLPAPVARLGPVPRARGRRPRPVRGRRRRARRLRRLQPRRPRRRGTTSAALLVCREAGRRSSTTPRPRPRRARPRRPAHAGRRRHARAARRQLALAAPTELVRVIERAVHRAAAAGLPAAAAARRASPSCTSSRPSYTVGAMCVIERRRRRRALRAPQPTGRRWGVPGGLARAGRGRRPTAPGARCAEEVGVAVELLGEPAVVVDPGERRVDVVYAARLADGVDPATAAPVSPEIVECRWFAAGELPELQRETAAGAGRARPPRVARRAGCSRRRCAAASCVQSRATLGWRSLPSARASIWRMRSA